MRFAITPDHREFFNKNRYVAFDEMLTPEQVAPLKKNAEETLAKRLKVPAGKWKGKTGRQLYQAGYDLWRDNDAIKKVTQKNTLATVASELLQLLPLRYVFDQYILTTENKEAPFTEPYSIQEYCSLAPLGAVLILLLSDLTEPFDDFPLPLKAGSGLFISPTLPIPWKEIYARPDVHFLMIGFGGNKVSFQADTLDPHAVNLKLLGYVFNEKLRNNLHPILLRK